MNKFVQVVSIPYYGNHGMRPKTDCIALVSNVAAKNDFQSIIYAIDKIHFNLKTDKKRNNLEPNVEVYNFNTLFKLFKNLWLSKPDVVFGNGRTSAGFMTAFFGKYRIFMSHQSMNPPIWWQKAIFKFFIRKFDAIKVANPYEVEQLVEIGVERKRIFYIPIPIDHEFFSRVPSQNEIAKVKKKIGLKPNEKFILSVSHIRSQKRAYTAIKALQLLRKKYPELKLVYTGKDMMFEEGLPSVTDKAKEIGIKGSVIVTGRLPEADLVSLMHSAEVGIISSAREGQCLTAYEKAAAGLPLCLSNIGSFTSVFNGSALFHEPEDHHALASNVEAYLENSEMKNRFTKINVDKVIVLTDYDMIWKKMENLFLKQRKKLQRRK